jgi:LPXTG-motif cell wall-anchored protein
MGGSRMKKIRRWFVFTAAALLLLQLTAGFDQKVFASTEKSSVGIKFEGSIPQSSSDSEEQPQTTNQDSHSNDSTNEHKHYPKTNEKNNPGMITTGLILILVILGWISWKNKKRETEK